MAVQSPENVITLIAETAVTQYQFVKMGSADFNVVPGSVAGELCLGVAMNTAAAGESVTVQVAGIAKVEAGAAITRGQFIQVEGSTGKAMQAATGNQTLGVALQSAADTEILSILISPAACGNIAA